MPLNREISEAPTFTEEAVTFWGICFVLQSLGFWGIISSVSACAALLLQCATALHAKAPPQIPSLNPGNSRGGEGAPLPSQPLLGMGTACAAGQACCSAARA